MPELAHAGELVDVLLGHLRHLEQTQLVLVFDKRATLDVGARLLGELHEELGRGHVRKAVGEEVENREVHRGAQVVHVAHEKDLAPFREQLLQDARPSQTLVQVAVSWRVPPTRMQDSIRDCLPTMHTRIYCTSTVAKI